MLDMQRRSNAVIQTITPDMATQWLRNNPKNRAISRSLVAEYKRAMLEHRWRVNGEAIKIAEDGRLLDGQHRLLACIEADCEFKSYVVVGLDFDTFDTIDVGKKRTAGDIVGMDGIANADTVAAAVRWVALLQSGFFKKANLKMGADEIRLFVAAEPRIETSVSEGRKAHKVLAPGIAGALHYLCSMKDKELADVFIIDLATGSNLVPGDPVLVLRERLIRERISRAKLPAEELMSLCIRAWNHRRGRSTGTVVLKGAMLGADGKRSYPEIL